VTLRWVLVDDWCSSASDYGGGVEHTHGTASVYLRRGVLLVSSESYLGCGGGGAVTNGWVMTGAADMDDVALGAAVRAALVATKCNVPMPDFSRPLPARQKVLAAVGVSGERQLGNGSTLVGVQLKDEVVELLPTRNDGAGGFSHLPELAEQIEADVDDTALGRRIRAALARSC
jgi:hypothetical protein